MTETLEFNKINALTQENAMINRLQPPVARCNTVLLPPAGQSGSLHTIVYSTKQQNPHGIMNFCPKTY